MIKVSPKAKRLLVPIVSVIAGFLVGAIIMLVWSYDPFQAYSSMFESALGSANGIGETIRNATPLIFIAIGFRSLQPLASSTLVCRARRKLAG